eukprot:ANDGO_07936.mRNA.1 Thymidylate kinase
MSSIGAGRGLFVVLEGVDRCGKSTQARLLTSKLAELFGSSRVLSMNFPNRSAATSTTGPMIHAYLSSAQCELEDHVIHLLFSANRWEQAGAIRKLLDQGSHIVCDRYAYSGVCFSAAKGMDKDWCMAPDRGLPRPDAVIFLSLRPSDAGHRAGFGGERYEKVEFLERVDRMFQSWCEEHQIEQGSGRSSRGDAPWFKIPADQPIEMVHSAIWQIVEQLLKKSERRELMPVAKLWMD